MCFQAEAYPQNPRYEHRSPTYNQRPPQAWTRSHYNYFKASMGFSNLEKFADDSGSIKSKDSSVLPINLAYGVSTGNIAFEGELGFAHHNFEFLPNADSIEDLLKGDLSATKLMFNGFFKTSASGSHFYLGGGLGLVAVSMDGIEEDLSGSSLATQVILGGEIKTNEQSGLFIEYKYLRSVGLELGNDFTELDFHFDESSVNVGLRYYF